MARPVNANADATRQRIREEAGRLFSEQGRAGTSVRDIARDAGVSVGMVNHYFGSKEALYADCVDAMYEELAGLENTLFEAISQDADPVDLVRRAVGAGFEFGRSHRPAIRLIMRSILDSGELDPRRREEVLLPFLERTTSLIVQWSNRPPASVRVGLQSIVFLVVRFSLSSDDELAAICGSSAAPERLACTHLEDEAILLLGLPSTPSLLSHPENAHGTR